MTAVGLNEVSAAGRAKSIAGIDTIRFVAAMWVAFSHGARFPLDRLIDKAAGPLNLILVGLANTMFDGMLAVVVFFIISGFCIHYPNIGRPIDVGSFYIRRMVRICIPLGVILLAGLIYHPLAHIDDAVLWSIYCEIVYYILYPALLLVWRKYSRFLLGGSILISLAMAALWSQTAFVWQLGPATWLICLPIWLSGAWLAERLRGPHENAVRTPWLWRLAAVAYCVLSIGLFWHTPLHLGVMWTVPPFALYAYFWIKREIEHFQLRVSPTLERLGMISYSIYLIHPMVIHYLYPIKIYPVVMWLVTLAAILGVSALFYLLVEMPSHRLARILGRRRPLAASAPA